MTGPQFVAWQASHSLSNVDLAKLLDLGLRSIVRYRAIGAPRTVELACRYLDDHPSLLRSVQRG